MANRVRIDDPGVMDAILEDIRTLPREYWIDLLARQENAKPGDIVLPGVQPRPLSVSRAESATVPIRPLRAKKPMRRQRATF